MIEYENIEKRVQKDIDRSLEIDRKYTIYYKRKRNLCIAVSAILTLLEIGISFYDGKMSIVGMTLLMLAGFLSAYLICAIEFGIIISMVTYFAINVSTLFLLYFFGSLQTRAEIFFGMLLCSMIGMSLAGVVGYMNNFEDNETGQV